ncbi:hypothetical protein D3C76_1112950 [compost metagenome]
MPYPAQQGGDLVALEFFVLLEVEVQVVLIGEPCQAPQVVLDDAHDPRQVPFVARVDADVAAADGTGHGHGLVDILGQRAADFQVHLKAQGTGLGGEGGEALGRHLRKAVVLAVEQVQREAIEFVPVGEIEHVLGADTTVGEVGQQRVAMGEQAQAVEPREQAAGKFGGKHQGRRGPGVVAHEGGEAGLDSCHYYHS